MELTSRELATVLHALRAVQEITLYRNNAGPCNTRTGCDHFYDHQPLTVSEIDALCERLNVAEPDLYPHESAILAGPEA